MCLYILEHGVRICNLKSIKPIPDSRSFCNQCDLKKQTNKLTANCNLLNSAFTFAQQIFFVSFGALSTRSNAESINTQIRPCCTLISAHKLLRYYQPDQVSIRAWLIRSPDTHASQTSILPNFTKHTQIIIYNSEYLFSFSFREKVQIKTVLKY